MKKRVKREVKKEVKRAMKKDKCCHKSCGGFAYFLGFLGAAVYFISNSNTFWEGVVGFLKAIVWPAFFVFEALKFFGA